METSGGGWGLASSRPLGSGSLASAPQEPSKSKLGAPSRWPPLVQIAVAGIVGLSIGALATFLAMRPPVPVAVRVPDGVRAADGCQHVYIDLGTNTGVQMHKLFNPGFFSESLVRDAFAHYFGGSKADRSRVCAFGWEPNPGHAAGLAMVEKRYQARGHRLKIFSAAAGNFDGWGVFQSDNVSGICVQWQTARLLLSSFAPPALLQDANNKEWASKVIKISEGNDLPSPDVGGAVRVMDVALWVKRNVIGRSMPDLVDAAREPSIVVKLDIEGSDEGVLFRMRDLGVLHRIDFMYIEHHVRPPIIEALQANLTGAGCATILKIIDDETYYRWDQSQPLPA